MKTIAFDLDGVVCEYDRVFEWYIWCWYGLPANGWNDETRYKFHYWIGNQKGVVITQHINTVIEHHWDKILPLRGAHIALKKFYKWLGAPITFVTARSKTTERATKAWLDRNLNVPYELIMNPHKSKVARDRGFNYFVEDRFRNVNTVASSVDMAFCIDQPHNSGRDFEHDNIIRVKDLFEVYNIVAE